MYGGVAGRIDIEVQEVKGAAISADGNRHDVGVWDTDLVPDIGQKASADH